MNAKTLTATIRTINTHVVPVVVMTVAFGLVLAYGPAAIAAIWDAIVGFFTGLSISVDHLFAIGQHARPASGLACWDEIKTALPTEHLCGDVAGAPASAVNFTAYPTN